jgi:hypothetical protein
MSKKFYNTGTWFIDMNMAVDQARHQDPISGIHNPGNLQTWKVR